MFGKKKKDAPNAKGDKRTKAVPRGAPAAVPPPFGGGSGRFIIRLREEGAQGQVWNFSLAGEIAIGRAVNCQVCLAEQSVSRKQCRLYYRGAAMIENLSTSNPTRLNEARLNAPAAVRVGDRITCGRVTVVVDALYDADISNDGDLNKGTVFINV